ncbi:hypothetical protein [Streptomyces sp. YIM 98790]|uniref:hypothetical protein n=1 Tax=Streptomyces sp. YIM 98790 TaxID=2689077 RepID=UPI00140AEC77|nr:hypothetical protein [Streptomyces sp. YIM 98790]
MKETHPEPAEISALHEDLLSAAEAAALGRHLDGCAECSAIAADLETLRQELSGLGDPGPMPEDIAARIDAALAAEAVSRETDTTAVSRETVPAAPSSGEGVKPRAWPWLALAAVTVLAVLGLGGVVLQSLSPPGSGADDAGAAADLAQGSEQAERSVAESDVTARVHSLLSRRDSAAEGEPFSNDDGIDQGGEDTGEDHDAEESGDGTQESAPGTGPAQTAPRCVLSATGRSSETPLAVDPYFAFDGLRTYLLVLEHSKSRELVDAYVVTAECTSGSSPQTGELLYQETVARP